MMGKGWLVFGGVLIAITLFRPRKASAATTAFQWRLDPTNYPPAIKDFARAIARAEGFYVTGSIAQRAHNPGNLKVPNTRTLGDGITVFTNDDEGWNALYRQLYLIVSGESAHYTTDMTIAEMSRVWTVTQSTEWAQNVARAMNADITDPLWKVLV